METFAVLPLETIVADGVTYRGPKYLKWGVGAVKGTGTIASEYTMSEYGNHVAALFYVENITSADATFLSQRADAALVPNLDATVTDAKIIAGLSTIPAIPSEWFAPPTTYRQLLTNLAELFSGSTHLGRARL